MKNKISEELVRCPACGMPTIPDKEGLTAEEMMCDSCYERNLRHEEMKENPEGKPEEE